MTIFITSHRPHQGITGGATPENLSQCFKKYVGHTIKEQKNSRGEGLLKICLNKTFGRSLKVAITGIRKYLQLIEITRIKPCPDGRRYSR